jgi:zinc D-Ala-D-Ala carboxypeptidase
MWSATCHTPAAPFVPQQGIEQMQATVVHPKQDVSHLNDSIGLRIYTKEELLGQFEPSKHPDFVVIGSQHTGKKSIYLQRAAYESFVQMHAAAAKAGVAIQIISATRNFEYQKGIWEKKWMREKYKGMGDREKVADIMKYSSMPGTSRHHWGTDVDFNSVELSFWKSGPGAKLYDWLVNYASEYGYYQTYTDKAHGRLGYEEEKWHWSYMPIAKEMHHQYRTTIKYEDISEFSGCKEAAKLKVFETYVDGIAPDLLPK